MRKIKSVLCLLLVLLMLPTISAAAVGNIDTAKELSLTVYYHDGSTPLVGATFKLYKVADMNSYGEFAVTDEFKSLDIGDRLNDDAEWKLLATTLEAYVLEGNIAAVDSGVTDENGLLRFPADGKSLDTGLYLILGAKHLQNGTYYEPTPLMLTLPTYDSKGDEWVYAVTVEPKFESGFDSSDTLDRKVIKIWNDEGSEDKRPKEIKVNLLCDGKVYATVVLSAENNWRYEWTGLDASHDWKVTEVVPDGYTVTISRDGTTFIVTNTPDTPGDKPPDEPKLPQTGQLWWPVAVLGMSGLVLLTLGLLSKKRDGHE